jgi:hypothetical protein
MKKFKLLQKQNRWSKAGLVGMIAILILLAACASPAEELEPTASSTQSQPEAVSASEQDVVNDEPEAERPLPTPTPQETSEVPQSILDAVIRDAQMRTGGVDEEATVQQTASVDWNDASLGCPRPGRAYSQVITPGYRIEVQVKETSYVYHTNTEKTIILCLQDGLPLVPVDPKDKIQDGEPWMPVD